MTYKETDKKIDSNCVSETNNSMYAVIAYTINNDRVFCNEASGDTLDLIGCQPSDLTDGSVCFESLFHDDDKNVADEIFANNTLADGNTYTLRLQSLDGSIKIATIQIRKTLPEPDDSVLLTINLYYSVKKTDDLVNRAMLMNFISLLDKTDDFIYFKDRHHIFTGASQTLVKITNAQSHWSELIGKTDYDVFDRNYADTYFELEKQLFNEQVSIAQAVQPFLDNAGNRGWVDNRKYPIKGINGEVVGLFGVARDITKIVEAEEALKKSEREYRNIYENVPVGLFNSSFDGILSRCNPAFALMLGYQKPEQILALEEGAAQAIKVSIQQLIKLTTQLTGDDEWVSIDQVEWKRWDDQPIYVELFGRRVEDADSEEPYIEGAVRDITSRVIVEEKLKRLNLFYASLSKCNEAIVRCKTEQELFETVCKIAVVEGALAMAWVGTVSEDCESILPVASYGDNREYLDNIYISTRHDTPEGQGPTAIAYREDRSVWCQNFQKEKMTRPWHGVGADFDWGASASIPLHKQGEVLGTLNLYAKQTNTFDLPEQNLLLELATDISYGIDRIFEERQVREYERQLRKSQSLNRIANRLAKLGAWELELTEMKLVWSDEIYHIHGLQPDEEITVERALEFYHENYQPIIKSAVDNCISEGVPYELDMPIVTKHGEQRWTRTSGEAVRGNSGKVIAIHGAMQDISSIKENEASLRMLSQAVEQSPSSIIITDKKAKIVYVNQAFLEQTGYTEGEVLGENPRILQSGKTSSSDYHSMWRNIEDGRPWRGEFYNKRKDGSVYIVSLLISPVKNEEGEVINYLAIEDDITEKKRTDERVHYLAHFDQLTGLPNRTLMEEHFEYVLNVAERNAEPVSVMFMDLDNFKVINDSLGHSIGDELLRLTGKRLKESLRSEDLVGRLGGDEFFVILSRTDADAAAEVAQKLVQLLSKPFKIGPYELSCSTSIGLSVYPEDGKDTDTLSKNADAAMYRVKQLSKNGFMFYTPEMQARSQRNLLLSNALRAAIASNSLYLAYQPQLNLEDRQKVGVEALLRWYDPELGQVSPAEFIPVAEENGLINEIGLWCLEQAISDMKCLMEYVSDSFQMAVNLSVVQFRNQNLVRDIKSLLSEYELPASRLTLELTEAVAMNEPEVGIAIIHELNELGVGIAIDDFGTGYSSLSYLKRLRVNKLKIDKSFIDDIEHDSDDRSIVSAIINMSQSLGLNSIAEGVETEAQINLLKQYGCNQIQGYFFSKPLVFSDLINFLNKEVITE